MSIDVSVSLYSFASKFFDHRYDLEDCLRRASEMGYKGVELVAAQMVEGYPDPSDEWCDWFAGLLKKYNLQPLSYSAYIDMGQHTGRDLTEEEIVQCTLNDMMYAKRLGFSIVRTQHAISPEILEKMIPYAKKWNLWVGVEMHAPHNLRVDVWRRFIELFERRGSAYIGVVPDMGIFQEHPHELFCRAALERGIDPERLRLMVDCFEQGMAEAQAAAELGSLSPEEGAVLADMYHTFHPATLEDFAVLVPHSKYMHGKFYYLNENCEDTSIPYEQIMQRLRQYGYSGHIAAEYEGHFTAGEVDCDEQLQRFATMMKRYLDA